MASEDLTFGKKLAEIRRDLNSIVSRMNRDGSEDVALLAQKAIMAVSDVQRQMAAYGTDDIRWTWEPADG